MANHPNGSIGLDKEGVPGMKARLLHDRIILKRIEETQTVKGGIIIPDIAKVQQEAVWVTCTWPRD